MPLIIYTTTSSKKEANNLAKKLCKKNLAACVQMHKIKSHYRWQGKAWAESEIAMSIKTRKKLYKKVRKFLRRHHSYKLPQIVALKAHKVERGYAQWLKGATKA